MKTQFKVEVDRGDGISWEFTINSMDDVAFQRHWLRITDFEGDIHMFGPGANVILSFTRLTDEDEEQEEQEEEQEEETEAEETEEEEEEADADTADEAEEEEEL